MSRRERQNMINYIEKIRGFDIERLIYMTDADIEHIYERTYAFYEVK